MNFYSMNDLKNAPQNVCDNIFRHGEAVITEDGKPALLMIDVSNGGFEETLRAIRQAKAMLAFNSMKSVAAANGYISETEIDDEIQAYRRERRENS